MDFAYAKGAPEMVRWSNTHCPNAVYWLGLFNFQLSVTSDFAMYIRKPRILGAVLVEARSMTYGDLGAKALLSVLVVVSH